MRCIDLRDIVGQLFLDFRKTFDLIDHSILFNKLSIYKFRDSTLKLFTSYILDRHQVMESNNGMTKPASIKSGVTQGFNKDDLVLMFLNDLVYSWSTAIVTTTQMMRRSILMAIYQQRLKSNINMMAIIQNFGVNTIRWK